MSGYAEPGNLLAVLAHEGEFYVANVSLPGVLESVASPDTPFGRLIRKIEAHANEPAADLLVKMMEISARGFVPSMREGPTGVGMPLKTMLGIVANSSRSPDYRGIEIKAARTNPGSTRQNRVTLFSKVPDWKHSSVDNPVSLLQQYGYDRDGRRQLYSTIGNSPNTLGFFLGVEEEKPHALHGAATGTRVVQWPLEGLRNSLSEKHQQSFWVKATSRRDGAGKETFHYVAVTHTRAPMVANLSSLLELGYVEVDFVLHLLDREPGLGPRARDHGYLFKIDPRNIGMLFPPSVAYSLQ